MSQAERAADLEDSWIKLQSIYESKPELFASLEDGRPNACTIYTCALCALVVFPSNYGYPSYTIMPLESLPADFRELVTKYRSTKLGQFVLDTYAKHRTFA